MKRILLIICVFAAIIACKEDEKAAFDLSITPSIIEFSDTESTQKVYITSNSPWTASSDRDWCTISILQKFGNDTAEVKVLTNTTYYERIAYISFINPDMTIIKTVKIIQKSLGKQMFREDDSIVLTKFFDAMGGDNWTNKSGWKNSNLENWYGITVKNDRVTGIKMENNNLSGELFAGLAELTALDTVSIVSEPGVTGSIPATITGLPDLVYLNISETSIAGDIPPELGDFKALEELILSGNPDFTGSIPKELGNLSKLKSLILTNISLEGNIPDELSGLTDLVYLSLSNNELTGKIPPSLALLSNLKHLILSDNSLSNQIPPEIANLNLETLRLENNYLSGVIPEIILDKLDGDTFNICPQKVPGSFEPDICK
jgi:Leucine-rich repeat (LRR) protein